MLTTLPPEVTQTIVSYAGGYDIMALLCANKYLGTLVKELVSEYCFEPDSMGRLSVLTILTTPGLTRIRYACISLNCHQDIAGIKLERCIVSLPTVDHIMRGVDSLPLEDNMYTARRQNFTVPPVLGCFFLLLQPHTLTATRPELTLFTNIPSRAGIMTLWRKRNIGDAYIYMRDCRTPADRYSYLCDGYGRGEVHLLSEPVEINIDKLLKIGLRSIPMDALPTVAYSLTGGSTHYFTDPTCKGIIRQYVNDHIDSSVYRTLKSIGRSRGDLIEWYIKRCVKHSGAWSHLLYERRSVV